MEVWLGTVIAMLVLLGLVFWIEKLVEGHVEREAWANLGRTRALPTNEFFLEVMPHAVALRWTAHPKRRWSYWMRPAGTLQAFSWATEHTYWEDEARRIRRSFLARTQATAEKWRNIFAALLAIFGAVFFMQPQIAAGEAMPTEVYVPVMLALIFGVQAVAYTGWASAGLPKMLVDVNAPTAFYEETVHAARSLARLWLGLALGGLSVAALVGAAVALVAPESW